jgi:hypothetical protein
MVRVKAILTLATSDFNVKILARVPVVAHAVSRVIRSKNADADTAD